MQRAIFGARASSIKAHELEIQRMLDQGSQAEANPDTMFPEHEL